MGGVHEAVRAAMAARQDSARAGEGKATAANRGESAMIWRSERLDSATVLIVESIRGQFARMITDTELKNVHDAKWYFWSAILDLKFCALGHSKSQAEIYQLAEDLKWT